MAAPFLAAVLRVDTDLVAEAGYFVRYRDGRESSMAWAFDLTPDRAQSPTEDAA